MNEIKHIPKTMKKIGILILLLLSLANFVQAQGVAINEDDSDADPSALLDLKSEDKGLLVPRMSESQRNLINSPAIGLMVFQTDGSSGFYYYDGTAWKAIGSGVGDGGGSVSPSTAAFETKEGVTSNAPGLYVSDDFVFGAPQLDNDGNIDHWRRFFFDKSKGAFRSGLVQTDQWDEDNIGNFSASLGINTIASGNYGMALGNNAVASGSNSVALGQSIEASGISSVVIGSGANATGFGSFAFGNGSESSHTHSIAMGRQANSSGYISTAIGYQTNASGYFATAMGSETNAPSAYEFVVGRFNTTYTPNANTGWSSNDRLFVVGNGISDASRSDALVILKNGDATFSGELEADGMSLTSDKNLKKDIQPLSNALENIQKLNGYSYFWKNQEQRGKEKQIGVIAQEVQAVYPELVNNNGKNLTVNYQALVPVLIEAIKEQDAKIESLETQNQLLEVKLMELESLQSEMDDIRALLSQSGLSVQK